ncbi:MAG: 4a-hydroxytetrahydrobiopterin dehydratase [Candidatus Saccharibacteria bacterium]
MKTFTESEITNYITQQLKDWKLENNSLRRDFKFKNFVDAFSFMTAIALEAEKADHHPDWSNSYNKVSIAFATHSEKGITQLDYDLAGKTNALYKRFI